jgi:hypothetical protein
MLSQPLYHFLLERNLTTTNQIRPTIPDWLKPKVKPYFHQISLECIAEIAVFMEGIDVDYRRDEGVWYSRACRRLQTGHAQ